ncbi:hypothetical protein [Piscinibacter sp.]|uniref:hypothetical protein n=1 Tax=Piscinibacter sp. TaxID=1903157 RepID=UPI002C6B2B17|nr:hypothetical protein [Albitalea sp.]HUG21035.1 hypothetical protein [Albitalea sp.]
MPRAHQLPPASEREASQRPVRACSLQIEAEGLLAGSEFGIDSRTVLELVRDTDCSAYDCEFIAFAIKLNTKLVTVDKKLLRAFPTRAPALAAG